MGTQVYGKVLRCTDKAFQFEPDGEDPVWIPFSQVEEPEDNDVRLAEAGEPIDIQIQSWLARKLGL